MQTIEELLATPRQVTQEDVLEFLQRNAICIHGELEEREHRASCIERKLKNLEGSHAEASTRSERLLNALKDDYKCATLQFRNDKNRKYNALEVKLRRAIEARDRGQIIFLTYGMEQLRNASIDHNMKVILNTIEYHQISDPTLSDENPILLKVQDIRDLHQELDTLNGEISAFRKALKDSPYKLKG